MLLAHRRFLCVDSGYSRDPKADRFVAIAGLLELAQGSLKQPDVHADPLIAKKKGFKIRDCGSKLPACPSSGNRRNRR